MSEIELAVTETVEISDSESLVAITKPDKRKW